MGFLNVIQNIVRPVGDIIDQVVTSEVERGEIRAKLGRLELEGMKQALDFEKELVRQKSETIRAEALGKSWLQRSWRPITMLTFLVLVVLDTLGLTAFRLSEQAWFLLQIGIGGYVVGRSAEKVVPGVIERIKK